MQEENQRVAGLAVRALAVDLVAILPQFCCERAAGAGCVAQTRDSGCFGKRRPRWGRGGGVGKEKEEKKVG